MLQGSTSKRPRDTFEPAQSPPPKRSKLDQSPAALKEITIGYDPCPAPTVVDYFYQDLLPGASELSQLFPTLCHDAYVVRRWLGSVGCVLYWRIVMEEINRTIDASNPSRNLAELIACSLAKLRGPQKESSGPKFYALCETLRLNLRSGGAGGIVIFGTFHNNVPFLPELTWNSAP